MDAQAAAYDGPCAVDPDDRDADMPVDDNANPTGEQERAADETLDRLARARADADTLDDAAAADAWRQVARLASRLHRQAAELGRGANASADR